MKNELDCEVVQDLLPNYMEGLTSEYTNESIRFHLDNCESCEKTYELLSEDENDKALVENNINEAKKLKWYMQKVKVVNLFLGILIAVILIYGGNLVYERLFTIVNYTIRSENIEITELYQLDDGIIYLTVKSTEPYFVGSAGYQIGGEGYEKNKIDSSVRLGRTTIGEKVEEANNSASFIVNTKNGYFEVIGCNGYSEEKGEINNIEDLVDKIKTESIQANSNIENIYYVGKDVNDKLLIWEDGMELPKYPY